MDRKKNFMGWVGLIVAATLIGTCALALRPALAASPTVLKLSLHGPKGTPAVREHDWWCDEVEKRSGGRVKFERYYGGALAKSTEALDAVKSGMSDVTMLTVIYWPGRLPLSTLAHLPGIFKSAWVNGTSYYQLIKQTPELDKEFAKENVKVVAVWTTGPYYAFSTNKPITKMEDLKGMKIIATGSIGALAKALGAAPIALGTPEVYEALQRGTAEGCFFGPGVVGTYSLDEVLKYMTFVPTGGCCGAIGMNLDTWKKLPPDIQKIIEGIQPDHAKAAHQIYQIDGDQKYMERFKKRGMKFIDPSPKFKAEVLEIAEKVIWRKWIEDQEKRNLPAKRVLETYMELLKKNAPLSPFK
jgi:TRAP-type C4-dicarboxylate transport system substrate-binding protein